MENTPLKNSIRTADDYSTKLPVTDLNIAPLWGAVSNLHRYKAPIVYVSGGLLGDFIHQLSVINENYIKSGRKGILYIANNIGGDNFAFGLQKAYDDTYPLISTQDYIEEYKIYNNEPYDINLTDWRRSTLLYRENWYKIFKQKYDVEWGKHKWLNINPLPLTDNKWKDMILINYSTRRPTTTLNFKDLYDKYRDKLLFISFSYEDYSHFIEHSGIYTQLYIPNSLEEFAIAINNCKLFIGGLSAPLALCFSMHKECIVGTGNDGDVIHFKDLNIY